MFRELVAHRFAVIDDRRAIDLATGLPVVLIVGESGDATAQRRWAVRCDALYTLRHRAIVPLIDYGIVGRRARFEAWSGAAGAGAPDAAARATIDRAIAFLRAAGLSAPSVDAIALESMRPGPYGPRFLPDQDTGYPIAAREIRIGGVVDVDDLGLETIVRRERAGIVDLFDSAASSRVGAVAVRAARGAGLRTLLRQLAREARTAGYAPIQTSLLPAAESLLAGLPRFIIYHCELAAAEGEGEAGFAALLDAAIRWPRPHVLLVVSERELEGLDNVGLEPIAVDRLVAAIRPARLSAPLAERVRRAAERSRGLPGLFAASLWGRAPVAGARRDRFHASGSRAAEQAPTYGVDAPPPAAATGEATSWPAPGELAALRRRADVGAALVGRGRHARGDRLLRQSVSALARRDDWAAAGRAALALAGSIARRGRARDARAVLEDASQYARRSGDTGLAIDVAVRAGQVWIDLARLDDAETALSGAVVSARAAGDSARAVGAALAQSRCLFWRGRYAEAQAVVVGGTALADSIRVRAATAESRAAVGRGDLARALATAADAVGRAAALGSAPLSARACCARAFAHLAAGDVDALERDAASALAAAHEACDPLLAFRARLLVAESARRRGEERAASRIIQKLTAAVALPPIVRARRDLVADLLAAAGPADPIVSRHVAATGLAALALFAPAPSRSAAGAELAPDEVVRLLQICQRADDDGRVLPEVCAHLRRELDAAAVAVFGADRSRPAPLASDGARVDTGVAERAATAGVAIAPHRLDERIEAAAPVRYGGEIIGAVAARWSLGVSRSLARAVPLLTLAAAAAAPAVAAGQAAAREAASPTPLDDFLGVSGSAVALRRAVTRAAGAPFSVLVEGESGSGKELVDRAVHRASSRRDRPLVTLNCAALPDDLVEAELFGHARGAFTGAVGERAGVFEEAHGGTLFLDEVGELSLRAQAKVLRVIQEGELRRVGDSTPRHVDVRLVSATNRDLRREVADGRFRLDLLYRLDVVRIVVEPLRERREDIALLADRFWRDATGRIGSRAVLAPATLAALAAYDWPGNVRELQNVLAALAVRAPRRGVVLPDALPPQFGGAVADGSYRLDAARRVFDERFIRAALVRAGGRRARAAAELGLTRQGLAKLMARLGLP